MLKGHNGNRPDPAINSRHFFCLSETAGSVPDRPAHSAAGLMAARTTVGAARSIVTVRSSAHQPLPNTPSAVLGQQNHVGVAE